MASAGAPNVPPASIPPHPPPPPPPPPPVPAGYAFGYRYAGLVERFLAVIIDLIILALIGLVIAIPLGIFAAVGILAGASSGYLGLLFGPFTLILFVLWILYFTYFEGTRGQTIGKMALHLRVISATSGQTPDMTHALVRSVLRIIDWLPTLYLLGFIVALLSSRKQRLGDLIADTLVVHA